MAKRKVQVSKRPESEIKYLQTIWAYLLSSGGAFGEKGEHELYRRDVQYYASTVNTDLAMTQEAYQAILDAGIDWNKTSDPAEHTERIFNGTFADDAAYIRYLKGQLVLNGGRKYNFGVVVPEYVGFGGLIRLLCKQMTIEEALARLGARVTSPDVEPLYFQYGCTLTND